MTFFRTSNDVWYCVIFSVFLHFNDVFLVLLHANYCYFYMILVFNILFLLKIVYRTTIIYLKKSKHCYAGIRGNLHQNLSFVKLKLIYQ
jgi:hypothetical protein